MTLARLDELLGRRVSFRSFALLRVLAGPIVLLHLWPFISDAFHGHIYSDSFYEPYLSWYPEVPRALYIALLLIGALAACCAGGYAVGRYATPRQPFYLIGTPIDLNANRARPSSNQNADGRDRQRINSNGVERMCGAPTKSGRPCRRKVSGGGYCWQHRDKFAPKK
jgi:hypothetical protein